MNPFRHNFLPFLMVSLVVMVSAGLWWHFKKPRPAKEVLIDVGPVTFSHDVAPIVFAKCSPCHHPESAGPFNLLTYDDARRRARQIADVTQKGFMPPWLPAEGHGDFIGARRLTPRELKVIQRWVETGTPIGDEAKVPAPPVFVDAWKTNPPDLILETPDYTLTGSERDVFRNFVVPVRLEEPKWVDSIEIRPTNPKVTHHARLGVDSSNDSVRRDAADPEPGYAGMAWGQDPDGQLVIWAPGMVSSPGPSGAAWRMYPNTSLVLHSHLQPSGKAEVVKFRIGIRYAKHPPQQRPVIMRIGSCDIDIPAGANHHTVKDQYVLPIDVDVHSIFPHAHSLCRELNVVAVRPDGTQEPLISIAKFDENWHDSYRFRQPVRLPRGTRLSSTFVYDNTDANPRNRNRPARRVVYGSHVTDEMADVYLQVTAVHVDQRAVLMEDFKQYDLQSQTVGYQKSLDCEPNDLLTQESLATCFVGLGLPGKAILLLEKRLKNGPKAAYPLTSLGMALLAQGNPVGAEEQLRQAITVDAEYPLAWFGLGKALTAQNKSEPAEQAYRRAVELAPGSLESRLCLVDVLLNRGELDKAAELCSTAASDSPDMANVFLKLAEISAKQKKYDASLEYCRKAQLLAPYTHPAKVLLAVFCCANGDGERGQKLLEEARAESPQHPIPPLILGQLARQKQQRQAAREFFKAAAALPIPDNWPQSHRHRFLVLLHSERLQLAQQLQDVALARDALEQWLKCEPNNQPLRKLYEELLRASP